MNETYGRTQFGEVFEHEVCHCGGAASGEVERVVRGIETGEVVDVDRTIEAGC